MTCILCGREDRDIRVAAIKWIAEPVYGYGPRCPDRRGCHDRVIANGDEWLVNDGQSRDAEYVWGGPG